MQYKYLYEDLETGQKEIVTSIRQLSDLCGINKRTISANFKLSDIYYHRHGKFKLERIVYRKDKFKIREKKDY